MEKIELHADKRDILGKKVRFLRRAGITPVHLFGHDIDSMALQCDTAELMLTAAQAGRTQLISLKIEKSRKPRMVLVREIQTDVMTGNMLHVDFYEVRMTEKINVDVPITLVGEAPAEKSKNNMLVHELDSLSIEVLPADIPAHIEVDISSLSEQDQVIRVNEIKLGEGVTVLTDPEHVVVRIAARPSAKLEEAEEVAEEGEGAAPEEAAPAEEQPQE